MTIFNIYFASDFPPDRMFAADVVVLDGHLVLRGEDSRLLAAYTPGAWRTCIREDVARRIPEEPEMDGEGFFVDLVDE